MKKIKRTHITEVEFTFPEELSKYDDYPKIINYVSTVELGIKLDINSIAMYLRNADRKPRRFAAITIKIKPTTGLLFSTGKMVIGGAKTRNESIYAAHVHRLYLEKIPQVFYDTSCNKFYYSTLEQYSKFNNFEVENVVGSGKLIKGISTDDSETLLKLVEHYSDTNGFANNKSTSPITPKGLIDLDSFARNNVVGTGWDKEIFPGLRFTIHKSAKCNLTTRPAIMGHVFEGANDVLMGAGSKEDIYKAHNFLIGLVKPHLLQDKNTKQTNNDKKRLIIHTLISEFGTKNETKASGDKGSLPIKTKKIKEVVPESNKIENDLIKLDNSNDDILQQSFDNYLKATGAYDILTGNVMSDDNNNVNYDNLEDKLLNELNNEFMF